MFYYKISISEKIQYLRNKIFPIWLMENNQVIELKI